jgi:hypothetical protein
MPAIFTPVLACGSFGFLSKRNKSIIVFSQTTCISMSFMIDRPGITIMQNQRKVSITIEKKSANNAKTKGALIYGNSLPSV